jgi:hypothetical protein
MFDEGALDETTSSRHHAKSRWWVVLSCPDADGRAIVVSFTDCRAFPANTDVWPQDMALTVKQRLAKDSTIHVGYAEYWAEADLVSRGGKFLDSVNDGVLTRARCNVCECSEHLEPHVEREFARFEAAWSAECAAENFE